MLLTSKNQTSLSETKKIKESSIVTTSGTNLSSVSEFSSPNKNNETPVKKTRSETRNIEVPRSPYKSPKLGDRFIPNRTQQVELIHYNLTNSPEMNFSRSLLDTSPPKERYKKAIARMLFQETPSKILSFHPCENSVSTTKDNSESSTSKSSQFDNCLKVLYSQNKFSNNNPLSDQSYRYISPDPERVLDAPEIVDDYYLNLLDWSSENILSVALCQSVYLWHPTTGQIQQLTQVSEEDNYITSLCFSQNGHFLAVGTNYTDIFLYDVETLKLLRRISGHLGRVSSLSWNNHILSSGSRDSTILNHDVRMRDSSPISTLTHHTQEVCGLKWAPDGSQLASGANDNLLLLWDPRNSSVPTFVLDHHQAAVKAIAWCPWQKSLLATGGGTADRTLRFWNTTTGACLNSVDTRSQVCAILWSKNYRELVSSHGFSQNQLIVWKYPGMHKIIELTGHTSRVLHMAMSPDGSVICSAASDETLRFWRVFDRNDSFHLKSQNKRVTTRKNITPIKQVAIR